MDREILCLNPCFVMQGREVASLATPAQVCVAQTHLRAANGISQCHAARMEISIDSYREQRVWLKCLRREILGTDDLSDHKVGQSKAGNNANTSGLSCPQRLPHPVG